MGVTRAPCPAGFSQGDTVVAIHCSSGIDLWISIDCPPARRNPEAGHLTFETGNLAFGVPGSQLQNNSS